MRYPLKMDGYLHNSRKDEGQVSIVVVLAIGLFLLLFIGFGVDMTNLFFHRQMAQNAADSACIAGATDMFKNRAHNSCTDPGGNHYNCGGKNFNPAVGTTIDCTGKSATTPLGSASTSIGPCAYAALNGFPSSESLATVNAGTEGNNVTLSFPASIPGIKLPDERVTGPTPYIQVDVYDAVRVYFSSLVSRTQTQQVHALAKCGMQNQDAPVPIIILDPTDPDTFSTGGSPLVQIVGGAQKSIQVNSDDTSAARIFGAAKVDLTKGGKLFNGSSFGVDGGPNQAPGGFLTANSGAWLQPQLPIADPFASVLPPADPGPPAASPNTVAPGHCTIAGNPCPVLGAGGVGSAAQLAGCPLESDAGLYECDGCPDPGGCVEYGRGDYSGGILVQNQTALFAPGVYYIEGGTLDFHANGFVRLTDPTQSPGDTSLGIIFYLTCKTPGKCTSGTEATTLIGANSGKSTCPAGAGQVACFPTVRAHCPGDGGTFDGNLSIPNDVPGNVLLAPCTNDGTYPFAPQAGGVGPDRGILFWQDRSASVNDSLSGGSGLLLDGTMYFHNCPNSPVCGNPPAEQTTNLTLVGGSGSNTRVLGEIVTDQLTLKGNSQITMDLNPNPLIFVLKVALYQ